MKSQDSIFTKSPVMSSSESEKGNDTIQSDSDCVPQKLEFTDFDGKQAWVVVAAAACSLFIYLGVLYSWGVMQVRLLETSSTSLTTLMFVGSLASSFMVSVSIPAGLMVRKFGYQITALTGAVLMGLGEFLASWLTEHVEGLFIVHSIMFGVGGGLSIFAVSTAPIRWFKKHRGLSMGIVLGGGSVGSAVMSVATTLLVKQVDVAWTFRILGFLLWAVCIPAAFLIHPPPGSDNSHLKLQWFRFRDSKFLILLIGTAFATFPLFIPPYFIPIFARTGSPIGSGLYSLSGRGDDIEAYRPAAYYGGAMSLAGMLFILAVRLTQTKRVFAKI
ncbi:hypothetical protein ACHAQA_005876 [Verticillium albo-atrum]